MQYRYGSSRLAMVPPRPDGCITGILTGSEMEFHGFGYG